jgi:hypothetical protein
MPGPRVLADWSALGLLSWLACSPRFMAPATLRLRLWVVTVQLPTYATAPLTQSPHAALGLSTALRSLPYLLQVKNLLESCRHGPEASIEQLVALARHPVAGDSVHSVVDFKESKNSACRIF